MVGPAVIAIAFTGYWVTQPKERFAYGVGPIEPNEAVLFTRHNGEAGPRFWVELVRDDGSHVWSAELTPIEPRDRLGVGGVVASEERIFVVGARDDRAVVVALDRASGKRIWESEAGELDPASATRKLLLDGERLYVVHGRDRVREADTMVTALRVADGLELWTLPPLEPTNARGTVSLLGGGKLLFSFAFSPTLVIDGASGRVVNELPASRHGCQVDAGIVEFAEAGDIVVTRDDRVATFRGPGKVYQTGALCGGRGTDIVVTSAYFGACSVQRLDAQTGTVRWQLSVGSSDMEPVLSQGELPRFVPLVMVSDSVEWSVVVVDLDLGRIVQKHPVDRDVLSFTAASRAYVRSPFAPTLLALDPSDGSLQSATSFPAIAGRIALGEEALRFGKLWLHTNDSARPTELAWITFDLATAQTAASSGGMVAKDVTPAGFRLEQ